MSLLSTAMRLAVRRGPRLLAKPLSLLPAAVQCRPVELALNKVFAEAIEDEAFDFLEGRWLRIQVLDMALSWDVGFNGTRLVVQPNEGEADATFSGAANDLILMASRKEDPDTLFFNRRLSIEGDTELGLAVKNLVDSIDRDELPAMFNKLVDKAGTAVQQYA
ncbi:putative lipid carrier protein YhbT [Sinobacterium caligoides]|uniref:Ubiquinone biosynthesis accessory factor UbiT n=1 Tax=Sinobacterium caligoides TaxID=933926 RepID=A0A3N2E047_9GAMM|nr:SCP2 sterol-binding domain-containing protein [Sinobacterium caligoides]ROS04945.1 putative lipid carrier protein YhbT [Sinobacterium caligoides]